MTFEDAVKESFNKELTKIAGFLRAGRRPFKAATLLKKTPGGALNKVSSAGGKGKLLRRAGLVGLGALGYDQGTKAKRDWQMGRAMRKQQQQGY